MWDIVWSDEAEKLLRDENSINDLFKALND
ncbi:hypothetical protein BPO_p0116 (plasmid) [Bergeyella porcorum]|uniref:Type II toxin-antitoxin system RelE/ParE family toxin n=1 Tax=Bergeyella porcorum TaxID=1735111 RepID=A0AAU0F366_9FLAO